ncbi:hypothetical protein ACSMXN_22130 [Jatrophihabitans sp. DSM 45814]
MPNIVLRTNSTTTTGDASAGFSRAEGRDLARHQNAEIAHGLITGTRVQAAGFVAGIAIHATAMLSREAAFLAGDDAAAAARLEHIVDSYTLFAAGAVARFQ